MAAIAAFLCAPGASADLGDCGQPKTTGPSPTATDALEVLKTAVGQHDCGGFDFCVCDVNSLGGVLAGDALRVLKAAVGQPVDLDCSCGTTTTTTTTLPAIDTSELMMLTKLQGSYTTSDMAGTWDGAALTSGASPEWRAVLAIDVQSDGDFTGTVMDSTGTSEEISGRLALSSSGVLTCTKNCSSSFRGGVDAGKTVAVVTDDVYEEDVAELLIVTRRGGSYTSADMTGTWAVAGLESGAQAPWWIRGTCEVAEDHTFDAHVVGSDGTPLEFYGTMPISGDGHVGCSSSGCSGFLGSMDSGKSVVAATQLPFAQTAEMTLMAERGASYSQADLTGTWFLGSLATGAGEPYWSRGTLTIDADGDVSGTLTTNHGASVPTSGRFAITSEGVVTLSSDASLRCALDSGKTILVCTRSR